PGKGQPKKVVRADGAVGVAFVVRKGGDLEKDQQCQNAEDRQQISEGETGRGLLTAMGPESKTPRLHADPCIRTDCPTRRTGFMRLAFRLHADPCIRTDWAVSITDRLFLQADFAGVQMKMRRLLTFAFPS